MPIEADIVDTEAIRIRLLLWRLLWVEAVALGTANMVTINDDAAALKNSLIVRALRRLRVLQSLIIMMRRGAFLFSIITGFVEKSVNYL